MTGGKAVPSVNRLGAADRPYVGIGGAGFQSLKAANGQVWRPNDLAGNAPGETRRHLMHNGPTHTTGGGA